jgi:hypothetical protein
MKTLVNLKTGDFRVKEVTRNSSTKTEFPDIHLYLASDPIPVPEATESDSETSWAL